MLILIIGIFGYGLCGTTVMGLSFLPKYRLDKAEMRLAGSLLLLIGMILTIFLLTELYL